MSRDPFYLGYPFHRLGPSLYHIEFLDYVYPCVRREVVSKVKLSVAGPEILVRVPPDRFESNHLAIREIEGKTHVYWVNDCWVRDQTLSEVEFFVGAPALTDLERLELAYGRAMSANMRARASQEDADRRRTELDKQVQDLAKALHASPTAAAGAAYGAALEARAKNTSDLAAAATLVKETHDALSAAREALRRAACP